MPIVKTHAFLLRKTPFKNSSFVLDVLTEQEGRISLIAKGAKKEKSPFFTRLDYLEFLEIVFIQKPHGMGILTECNVKDLFIGVREDPRRMACGLMFFRLLRDLCTETEADPGLFRVCSEFLKGFAEVKRDHIRLYYLYALLRIIEQAGYSPELENCPVCGQKIENGAVMERGTHKIICKGCAAQKKGKKRLELSPNSINIIWLYKNRDISEVFLQNSGSPAADEIESFLLLYLSSLLNKDITSMTVGNYNA